MTVETQKPPQTVPVQRSNVLELPCAGGFWAGLRRYAPICAGFRRDERYRMPQANVIRSDRLGRWASGVPKGSGATVGYGLPAIVMNSTPEIAGAAASSLARRGPWNATTPGPAEWRKGFCPWAETE